MTEELKPCPFCGGPAERDFSFEGGWYAAIKCGGCNTLMIGKNVTSFPDENLAHDELVLRWNKRVEQ